MYDIRAMVGGVGETEARKYCFAGHAMFDPTAPIICYHHAMAISHVIPFALSAPSQTPPFTLLFAATSLPF